DYIRKPIPDAFLLDPEHDPVTLRDMTATEPVLLVFVNCSCGSTRQSWERLVGWDERLPGVRVLGVQTGPFGDFGIGGVAERLFYDPRSQAWQALGIGGTSAAVLLGADGLLAGGPVHGNDEVEQFVDDIAELLATAPATSDDTDTT